MVSTRIIGNLGTVLAGIPLLAGLLAALMALAGRFGGGIGAAFTAFWYVAAAAAPVALIGAVLLVIAHRRGRYLRVVAAWVAVALGGWVFGLGSAQVSGLAGGPESAQQPWQLALLGVGVAAYLLGLVGLVVVGWRARRVTPAG